MIRVIIARHGNTFDKGDVVTRVGARTDLPLSESGKQQAVSLGQHLLKRNFRFEGVFCSTLSRTQQTAEIALKEMQADISPEILSFLTEIDYGPDENLPEDVVQERIGQLALERWEKEGIPPQGWIVDPDALRAQWKDFLSTLQKDYARKNVLVVTSNGIARFALQAIDPNASHTLKLKTGAYGEVVFQDGQWNIEEWNVRP